jgi:hypothetical protein
LHDKNDVKNVRHPDIIFGKYKDGTFTKKALLCQDILKYCIIGKYKENDNESFRLWNLTKWLLEVNQEYINYFKDEDKKHFKKHSRKENRLPTTKRNVEKLANIGLIKQVRMKRKPRELVQCQSFNLQCLDM